MHYKKSPPTHCLRYALAAFFAQSAWVLPLGAQALDPSLWHLNRSSHLADQPFRLQPLSYRYSCAVAFSEQSVQVGAGRLDLSFHAEARPGVACPAILERHGPTFSIPALASGAYRVFLHPRLPCHQTQAPTCIGRPEEDAGTLRVTEAGQLAYALDPTQVQAGGTFSLKLHMPEFTCGDVQFLRLSSRREGGKVVVSFLPKGGEGVCRGQPQLYGPAFALAGLPAGTYEIWAERLPACAEQGCDLAPETQLAGYLSAMPKEGATRAAYPLAAPGSASRGGAVRREGGLVLRLPEGAEGTWRAEVLDLSGRRLYGASVIAGSTAVLRGIPPGEPGLLLIRLVSPKREAYTLRVADGARP